MKVSQYKQTKKWLNKLMEKAEEEVFEEGATPQQWAEVKPILKKRALENIKINPDEFFEAEQEIEGEADKELEDKEIVTETSVKKMAQSIWQRLKNKNAEPF